MTPATINLVHELLGKVCFCGKPKRPGKLFCFNCFSHLSRSQQAALYRKLDSGYEAAYDEARKALEEWMKFNNRGEK